MKIKLAVTPWRQR